jgi:hypothetical protein
MSIANVLSNSWLGLLCLILACASSAETPSEPKEDSVRPGINERFLAEDLDVEHFVKIFEGESREVYAQRERIVEALGVSSGATVADIGAGTGLFLPAFNREVSSDGRVYAVEISPRFLEHLRERASVQPVNATLSLRSIGRTRRDSTARSVFTSLRRTAPDWTNQGGELNPKQDPKIPAGSISGGNSSTQHVDLGLPYRPDKGVLCGESRVF